MLQKEVRIFPNSAMHCFEEAEYGAMLEVPALLWQLDELMAEADFVSVGSNDLFQFVMAVDRGNTHGRPSDSIILGRAVPAAAETTSCVAGARNGHAGDAVRRDWPGKPICRPWR
jgi:phosphoenolpyruvate synthase/pyruvate phosphate dikinase